MSGGTRQPRNGSSRLGVGLLVAAGGVTLRQDDPMTKVFALDASSSGAGRWLVYLVGAIALLLGLTVGARAMSVLLAMTERTAPAPVAPQEIDVMKEEPPSAPPVPPAEPEAKPEPAPPPVRVVPREAPPPAPAQAGKVLTAEPDPNEPVDLTGNTIISGNADSYAGGVTAANGTSPVAVRGVTNPNGPPATAVAPAGPDRSRRASVVDSNAWLTAPFPPEADQAQIDDAHVTIQIDVRSDGIPSAVRVLKDPGHGFGREARKYALGLHYNPALDRDGNPVASVFTLPIHYSR
jgi:protein TonB